MKSSSSSVSSFLLIMALAVLIACSIDQTKLAMAQTNCNHVNGTRYVEKLREVGSCMVRAVTKGQITACCPVIAPSFSNRCDCAGRVTQPVCIIFYAMFENSCILAGFYDN